MSWTEERRKKIMCWTDQGGNPECECGHLWSNHYNKDQGGILGMYFCEAPECVCTTFEEITTMDRLANSIFQLEESEVVEEEEEMTRNYDYDCERHGKGKGHDCPTCFASDEKIRGRYVP